MRVIAQGTIQDGATIALQQPVIGERSGIDVAAARLGAQAMLWRRLVVRRIAEQKDAVPIAQSPGPPGIGLSFGDEARRDLRVVQRGQPVANGRAQSADRTGNDEGVVESSKPSRMPVGGVRLDRPFQSLGVGGTNAVEQAAPLVRLGVAFKYGDGHRPAGTGDQAPQHGELGIQLIVEIRDHLQPAGTGLSDRPRDGGKFVLRGG